MRVERDPAEWLRETLLDLAQVPAAGLQAASWWYQQWAESTSSFLAYAAARVTLEPASGDTDVLVGHLVRASERLARQMINLPGQSVTYFNGQLERQRRELLSELRPDASTEPLAYVSDELDRLASDIARLKQIAAWHPELKNARALDPGRGAYPRQEDPVAKLADLVDQIEELAGQIRAKGKSTGKKVREGDAGLAAETTARRNEALAQVKGVTAALDASGVRSHLDPRVAEALDELRKRVDEQAARPASGKDRRVR